MRLIVMTAVALLMAVPAFATGGTGIGKGHPPAPSEAPPPPPPPMEMHAHEGHGMMATGGMVIVHHRVADYARWREVYDADQAGRDGAGLTHCRVHQSFDNPDEVLIACEFTDLHQAKEWADSRALKRTMRKAGVRGRPEILYLMPPH